MQGVALERRWAGDGTEHEAETQDGPAAGGSAGGPHAQAFTSGTLGPSAPAGRLVTAGQGLWEEELKVSVLCSAATRVSGLPSPRCHTSTWDTRVGCGLHMMERRGGGGRLAEPCGSAGLHMPFSSTRTCRSHQRAPAPKVSTASGIGPPSVQSRWA